MAVITKDELDKLDVLLLDLRERVSRARSAEAGATIKAPWGDDVVVSADAGKKSDLQGELQISLDAVKDLVAGWEHK